MVNGRPDHYHTLEIGTGDMHETVLSSCRRRYGGFLGYMRQHKRVSGRSRCDSVLFSGFQ